MVNEREQITKQIEELRADEKKLKETFSQFPVQRKEALAFSDKLFNYHEASLSPLKELTYLPLSASSEAALQDLLDDFHRTGHLFEEMVDEKLESIRKEERKLEGELEDILIKRKQQEYLLEELSKQEQKD